MATDRPHLTEELNGAPLADLIHAVALAIADGQFHMDQAGLRSAEFLSGRMPLRDPASGRLLARDGSPTSTPEMLDTRVQFGWSLDAQGRRVPGQISMMELGFVPTFYQFVDTVIDMKLALRLHRQESESATPADAARTPPAAAPRRRARTQVTTTPVDARYASTYTFSADLTSRVRTKLVPVPPPAVLEERIRALLEQEEQERQRSAAGASARASRALASEPLGGPALDGTTCYDVGDAELARALVGSAFTIEAWVRPERLFGRLPVVGAWSALGDARPGWQLAIEDARFMVELSSAVAPSAIRIAARGNAQGEAWQHLAATYDGTVLKLFVDGQLSQGSDELSGVPIVPASARLVIGGDGAEAGGRFVGIIDDVRLWRGARSGDEIRRDLGVRLAGDEPGLIGYWRFDRATAAGAVPDSTGGHDAQIRPVGS